MNAATAKDISAKSINICIDLNTAGAQEIIEGYFRAFKGFAEVEYISDEVAVVRFYPGGAAQLRKGCKSSRIKKLLTQGLE